MSIKKIEPLLILCIGLMLAGFAAADETYGAYPTNPTQVPTPAPTTTTNYVSGQTTAYTTTTTPASSTGTVAPGVVAVSGASAMSAIYSTAAPPATQQNTILAYDIQTAPPSYVYYSGSSLPWASFYQVFPANSPSLWISTYSGWAWYATCPVGCWLPELMYVPVTGTMKLYDLYPDGTTRYNSYGFVTQGYKLRWMRADAPGRYLTMLTISDIPSNYVTIDAA